MKPIARPIAGIILTALVACASVALAAQQAAQTARLSGRVVSADSNTPVRSADVTLIGATAGLGTKVASTDDEGRFDLPDVPAGTYTMQISKAGFVTSTFGPKPGADQFNLSPGQHVKVDDLRLVRAGAVTGRVLDTFGEPIADVAVTAWRVQFLTPAQRRVVSTKSFRTNDLGEFRVYGLQPGQYFISASRTADALVALPTFYPGTGSAAEATAVELKGGQDVTGIQIQLTRMAYGQVTGTVTTSTARPYDSAVVWLIPARADDALFSNALMATTDAQGQFRIVNVSPGAYSVEVFSRAWTEKVAKTGSASAGPPGDVGNAPVTVTPGSTQDVSVQTSRGFRVRGRVIVDGDAAAASSSARFRIAALPARSAISAMSVPAVADVGPDGSFVLEGVYGDRIIRLQNAAAGFMTPPPPPPPPSSSTQAPLPAPPGAAGRAAATASGLLRVMLRGNDVTDQGIALTADIDGLEVHVTSQPSRVEGRAVTAAGEALGAYTAAVFSIDRNDWMRPHARKYTTVQSKADGTFVLTGLPAGNYLAAIVPDANRDRWADPDYLDSLRPVATPFTVTDGSTTAITLQVRR